MCGELVDFSIITNNELTDEELFIYNTQKILLFACRFNLTGVVTEALALHAKSKDRDKLFGQFWYLQCKLKEKFFDVPRGKITVTEWRSKVLSKEEQREAKKAPGGLKQAVIDKLPADVKSRFCEYLSQNKLPKKCLEDLADSYFLGQYRRSLG